MLKDCYTVKDIAEALQVKERAVRELIGAGELKAVKILNKWIVTAKDFERLINPNKKESRVKTNITACEQCEYYSLGLADMVSHSKRSNRTVLRTKEHYCAYYGEIVRRLVDDPNHHIVFCKQEKQ